MSVANKYLVGTFLVATLLLCANAAQGMEIQKFDKMAGPDQDAYITELVQGAERVLNSSARASDAQAIHKLFTTNDSNGVSIGMNKFMMYLALTRVTDAERVVKDPNVTRLQVEHAVFIMLKKESIVLPPTFMHVMDDFKPKKPLR